MEHKHEYVTIPKQNSNGQLSTNQELTITKKQVHKGGGAFSGIWLVSIGNYKLKGVISK